MSDANREKLLARFWAKVNKTSHCWIWLGSTRSGGYGRFHASGRTSLAHRFAYEAMVGLVPDGLQLDHLCRNRACVNPLHLEPVTAKENNLRGESPSAERSKRTHCPLGHPLSGENLRVGTRSDGRTFRQCLACYREAHKVACRHWRLRQKDAS